MLKSISEEIKEYNSRKDRIATLVIIHELDMPKLIKEMKEADMVPNDQSEPFQIYGIRLIRTQDISQGVIVAQGNKTV